MEGLYEECMKQNSVKVTVLCTTYNQEEFIRDALEGFVIQKTTFPFRVIVHDDASKDSTPEIIMEYANRYPDIIIPVLEKENQYSKGTVYFTELVLSYAEGEYFATCEGDDYWIDPNKLQLQYDILENNKEINACTSGAYAIDPLTKEIDACSSLMPFDHDCIISVDEVIRGGGGFIGTPSMMYRRAIFDRWPEFFKFYPHDYNFQIYGAMGGGIYYFSSPMSCIRKSHAGSFTYNTKMSWGKAKEHNQKVIRMLEIFDNETEHRYKKNVRYRIRKMKCLGFLWFCADRLRLKLT